MWKKKGDLPQTTRACPPNLPAHSLAGGRSHAHFSPILWQMGSAYHNQGLPLTCVGAFYTQTPSTILQLHFSGPVTTEMFLLYQQVSTNVVNLVKKLWAPLAHICLAAEFPSQTHLNTLSPPVIPMCPPICPPKWTPCTRVLLLLSASWWMPYQFTRRLPYLSLLLKSSVSCARVTARETHIAIR